MGAPLCAGFAGWERRMSRTPDFDFVSLFSVEPASLMPGAPPFISFFVDEPIEWVPYPPRLSEGGLRYCLRPHWLRLLSLSHLWSDVASSASPLLLHEKQMLDNCSTATVRGKEPILCLQGSDACIAASL